MTVDTERVLKGLWWTFFANVGAQLITWSITIIIARILSPEDYGIVGISGIYMLLITYINNMGISSAIVQKKEITESQIRTLYTIAIILGIILMIFTYFASIPFSIYFNEPVLIPLIRVYSVSLLLSSLSSVQISLLTKNMEFKKLSFITFVSRVLSIIAGLILAVSGFGVWTLVGQFLAIEIVNLLGAVYYSRIKPGFLSSERIRNISGLLRYGFTMMQSSILFYFSNNVDHMIIGKLLGKSILGPYTMALNLADKPFSQITTVVNRVFFPFFSKLQDEKENVRHYLIKRIRIELAFILPLFIGITVCADDIVLLFLGEKWKDTVLPLKAFCGIAFFKYLASVLGNVTASLGIAHYHRNFMAVLLVAFTGTLLGLIKIWGFWGAVIVWVTVYPAVVLVYMGYFLRFINIKAKALFQSIYKIATATIIMGSSIIGLQQIITHTSVVRLLLSTLMGFVLYICLIFLIENMLFRDIAHIVKIIRKKKI